MGEKELLEDLRAAYDHLGVEVDAYLDSKRRLVNLSRIVVKKSLRGQGLGTKAMEDLTQYADIFGLMITLSPSTDFGGTSVDRLKRFYSRFGFVNNKGRNKLWEISESMYRLPQRKS